MFNAKKSRVNKLRISGGEPTLCKEHLLGVLDLISTTKYLFILETNGILLGSDPDYVNSLAKYPNIHVRVSLKAGTPEGFQERTGARGEFYELPYLAIKSLSESRVNFHVAVMSDARLMSQKERGIMIQKLKEIGYHDYLEEELCDSYQTAVIRLKESGFELKW